MKVVDQYEGSAIVVCPECRGPYIVASVPVSRGLRKCPHCNAANAISFDQALAASIEPLGVRKIPG